MKELRKYTHEDRLNIGRQISDQILSKYKDAVLAVFISGSTAKSLDRPYSDLELIAVVRDGVEIPTKYYLYRGIVIEVDYTQESNMLKAARRVNKNWPIEADQYRNRIVLFEHAHWTRKLDQAVEESDRADSSEALRVAAVELTEDLSVLLNAHLAGDTMGVMNRGRALAGDAAVVVLLLNRCYVTTTSWFWKQAFACELKPGEFESHVKIAAGFTPASPEEVVTAGQKLYEGVMKMVEARRIFIDSEELIV